MLFHRSAASDTKIEPPAKFTFAELNDDAFDHSPLFSVRNRHERFRRRLAEGHRCFGFTTGDGRPVTYMWLTRMDAGGAVPVGPGVALKPGGGDAYIWDCRTDETVMRRGLYRGGLLALAALAEQDGASDIWIDCAPDNTASRAGIASAGFQPHTAWNIAKIGGFVCFRQKGTQPRYGLFSIALQLPELFGNLSCSRCEQSS